MSLLECQKAKASRTDGWTDGRTDRRADTHSHSVASSRLKIVARAFLISSLIFIWRFLNASLRFCKRPCPSFGLSVRCLVDWSVTFSSKSLKNRFLQILNEGDSYAILCSAMVVFFLFSFSYFIAFHFLGPPLGLSASFPSWLQASQLAPGPSQLAPGPSQMAPRPSKLASRPFKQAPGPS